MGGTSSACRQPHLSACRVLDLALCERLLAQAHACAELIAQGLNNLAALYDDQGQYEKAEPLYQRSLAIREGAGSGAC